MLWIERKHKEIVVNINDRLDKKLELELEIIITDKNGKVIKKIKRKAKSWLKNFALILKAFLEGSEQDVVDVDGNTVSISGRFSQYLYKDAWHSLIVKWMGANAGDDDDSYGIVVGSGDTPVSPTDNALASKIPHGTGSGQLDYDSHSFTSPSISDSKVSFNIARSFKNSSGGDVTVVEVGIIIHYILKSSAGSTTLIDKDYKVLIVRDVLDESVTVPDGGGLTAKYTISVSSDFLENFMKMLYGCFTESDQSIVKYDGSSGTIKGYVDTGYYAARYHDAWKIWLIAGDDDDGWGIILGSNNSVPFDPTQYNAQSKINHGTGSGQLDYQTHTTYDLEELSDRFRIKITRSFYNGSGGQVSVGEIILGVYEYHRVSSDAGDVINDIKYAILRKVLPSLIDVDPDATLTVNYYLAIPK